MKPRSIPHIYELIYGETNQVAIHLEDGELSNANGMIDGIPIVALIGSKDLQQVYLREEKYYDRIIDSRYSRHDPRRTNVVLKETLSGVPNIARNLSVVYSCTAEEAKEMLLPLMNQGLQKIYTYTLANSRNLPNNFTERFGFKNKWLASGSPPDKSEEYIFINQLLKEKGSPYRILNGRVRRIQVIGKDV